MKYDFKKFVNFVRTLYGSDEPIALHEPRFPGNEKKYINETIDSTFVSSVGKYVDRFEQEIAKYCGVKYAVATVNGTAALHIALVLAGVKANEEVITQPLTFVATGNSILYVNATPVFIDVDTDTLGLSPEKLEEFLCTNVRINDSGECINLKTGKRLAACVPMHTFGFPARIKEIIEVCKKYNIIVVEDCAESLGSFVDGTHTGNYGLLATLSFNGNKIVTCGGGGAIITNDLEMAKRAKHLTTTAKKAHQWKYFHDELGYNYRMPNLNAALACAQLEQLDKFLVSKRELAKRYEAFFGAEIKLITERNNTSANYWLNTILLNDINQRDAFLAYTNSNKVMTRPAWTLLNKLPAFKTSQVENIDNSLWLEDRLVNIPSSVILK